MGRCAPCYLRALTDTASFEVIGEVSNFLTGTLIIYIAVGP